MDLENIDSKFLAMILAGALIGLAIGLIPYIFYALTLSKTIKQCAIQNQKIRPGQVWLTLIPLFGPIWHFVVVARMADMLAAEFRLRNIQVDEERPAYNIGLAFCICGVLGWVQYLGVPYISGLAGIAGLICWIIYWVRIARYKKLLEQQQFQFGQGNPYVFPDQFPNQPR